MHVTARLFELTAAVQVSYFFAPPAADMGATRATFSLPFDDSWSLWQFEVNLVGGKKQPTRSLVASLVTLNDDEALLVDIAGLSDWHGCVHVRVLFATALQYNLPERAVEFLLAAQLAPCRTAGGRQSASNWPDWQSLALGSGGLAWSGDVPPAWSSAKAPFAFSLLLDAEQHCIDAVAPPASKRSSPAVVHWSYALAGCRRRVVAHCLVDDDDDDDDDDDIDGRLFGGDGFRLLVKQRERHGNSGVAVLEDAAGGSSFAVATIYPEAFPEHLFLARSVEIVFVVDCSGSMSQAGKMGMAVESMKLLLRSLEDTCHFNVFAFGSSYSSLWPTSRAYSKETFAAALAYVQQLSATLGGTELLKPLEHIFALQPPVARATPSTR